MIDEAVRFHGSPASVWLYGSGCLCFCHQNGTHETPVDVCRAQRVGVYKFGSPPCTAMMTLTETLQLLRTPIKQRVEPHLALPESTASQLGGKNAECVPLQWEVLLLVVLVDMHALE
jgi:hypothetical protein